MSASKLELSDALFPTWRKAFNYAFHASRVDPKQRKAVVVKRRGSWRLGWAPEKGPQR